MKRWRAWSPAKPVTLVLALVLAGVIGCVEYATGYVFHLTAFFLVPICWVGWVAGRRAGLLLAMAATVIRLATDLTTGHPPYRYQVIPYWDALMLLAFFVAVVYSLSAFRDAHRKLLAARALLQNQNELLEQAVGQRTAALQTEIAERKRAEKAKLQAERLAMVGTIAAQVAHEVRNPLGSITLNLDLIAKQIEKLADSSSYPPEEARVLLKELREEVRRIQCVIEDYLRFARLPKMQRKPVELNEFLEQKLAFMGPVFEKASVRLHTQFDAGLKTINADAEQLWQALLNLVRNSLEAMPEGGTLVIGTQRDKVQALLSVTDSGKGMSEEQLKQVFVPFFTTKPRGTGLGLSLTQQILSEHGAQIECVSSVGKGTTFTVHFPLPGPS